MLELTLSDNGLELLKQLEGFRAIPYRDAAGLWTVGYGHKVVPGDGVVVPGDCITSLQASKFLIKDTTRAVDCVNNCVTSNINQNQFDALVLFAYNVGASALQNSTLLKLVNEGDYSGAAGQFLLWDKAHVQGQFIELAGLKNRRTAEKTLFELPVTGGISECSATSLPSLTGTN